LISSTLERPEPASIKLPDLSNASMQGFYSDVVADAEFILLDNISTLCPGAQENDADGWAVMQAWILQLRRQGKSVLLVHHDGKGGQQRGTSKREDVLDSVISLRRPPDYTAEDGLRCEVYFEKIRGRARGSSVQPFELKLQTDEGNRVVWTHRPLKSIVNRRAFEMFTDKESNREISDALGISRYKVYRLRKKFDVNPDPDSLVDE